MMTIPSLDSFSDTLKLLKVKKTELNLEKSSLVRACAVIRARMQQDSANASNAHENKVRQLLGQPTVTESLSDRDQLQANLEKLEVINAAICTLDAEILKQSGLASTKLIESQSEEIKRRGNRWAKAYVDVHTAHSDFEELIDALEDAGASVGHLRIRPNGVSHTHDRSGNYFYAIQEFIEAGFLSKGDMPKVLN
jgi:hypothetical protein